MSPSRSKTISFPSGETSRLIQVPSSVSMTASTGIGYAGFSTSHFFGFSFSLSCSAPGAGAAVGVGAGVTAGVGWATGSGGRSDGRWPIVNAGGSAAARRKSAGSQRRKLFAAFIASFRKKKFRWSLLRARRGTDRARGGERQWDRDREPRAAVGQGEVELVVRAVEQLQPLARVLQADAVRCGGARGSGADPVVADLDPQAPVVAPGGERDPLGAGILADAVLDGVLDERLQEERRDPRLPDLGIDLDGDLEPVAEAHPLDGEVPVQHVDLGLQRDGLFGLGLQVQPQEVGQPVDGVAGELGVLLDQRKERVQRVEEEVRAKLLPQRVQLRLRERGP